MSDIPCRTSLFASFREYISKTTMPLMLMAVLLSGCDFNTQPSSDDAREKIRDAYIFAYPMLENYRAIYFMSMDQSRQRYTPFNQLTHSPQPEGPENNFIVESNNDTVFSRAVLDLRAEPIVITVPAISDRYYSVQLVDLYTHNLGYIGTRSTGAAAGSYVVAGPNWAGLIPAGCENERFRRTVKKVFYSETNFVTCLIRTGLSGPEDLPNVYSMQQKYKIRPLSAYLGTAPPNAPPMDIFPPYNQTLARSPAFISYFNFLLGQLEIHPSEKELFERFAEVNIGPGLPFLTDQNEKSYLEGIKDAILQIESADTVLFRMKNGWTLPEKIFGNREIMQGRYLVRAKAARYGLWGNDIEEAYYPSTGFSEDGNALNGALNRYKLVFGKAEVPQVNGFWSLTMYNAQGFMVENPIQRYSIGDRTKNLKYGADGSLTILLQYDPPADNTFGNWLPSPAGPFKLTLRMYLPKPEAIDPLYAPPPVRIY